MAELKIHGSSVAGACLCVLVFHFLEALLVCKRGLSVPNCISNHVPFLEGLLATSACSSGYNYQDS